MLRKSMGIGKGNNNGRRESTTSNDREFIKSDWLKDEIDPDLLSDGVPAFTENRNHRTETKVRLNSRWFVEWEEEGGSVEVELGSILFHNRIEEDDKIGIEINSVLPNTSQPETRRLFFTSEEDRRKAEILFMKSKELVEKMTFSRDMVPMYLHREFKNLKPKLIDGVKKIKRDDIRRYFKHSYLEVPKDTLAEDHYSFEDWQNVYDKMMGQQTSKMLQSVFRHYSVWGGENQPWKMKPKNLEDFLRNRQQDSRQYSLDDIHDIIKRHKKEVIS